MYIVPDFSATIYFENPVSPFPTSSYCPIGPFSSQKELSRATVCFSTACCWPCWASLPPPPSEHAFVMATEASRWPSPVSLLPVAHLPSCGPSGASDTMRQTVMGEILPSPGFPTSHSNGFLSTSPVTSLFASCFFSRWMDRWCAQLLSCVQLFASPWPVPHQAPMSMGFCRQEYWVAIFYWGIFPTQGSNPCLLCLLILL